MAGNDAIRFLRTKTNANVTQSDLYDLMPGQPLFDQKNNLLYIGTSYYDAKSLVPCYRHVITVCWKANRGSYYISRGCASITYWSSDTTMAQKDTKKLVNDICPKATSIVGHITCKGNVADAPIREGTIINIEPNPGNTDFARISMSDSSNNGLLFTYITDDDLSSVSWEEKVYPSTPYVK